MNAAPQWTTACPDWEQRIVEGRSLIAFPPLFPSQANEALEVFNSLKMVDAPGSPYLEEITLQWAVDFVSQIFGSYDPETGVRHITEYFMLISKKNSKSSNAAAIMMVALVLCWRQSGEFIVLSPTIEIAGNSFKPAADMVKADPELCELLHVQEHTRTITHLETGASLKVVAADTNTVGGKKAIGVLIDELWLFGKMPNAASMLREATGGLASRPEGFVIYLSTQSNEPPAGVFKEKLEYARGVRDGVIDDNRFLPVIYEFPKWMIEKKLHLKPENFYITNPNLIDPTHPEAGGSVSNDYLVRELRKAELTGAGELIDFCAKHLNVEVGMNLRNDRWPGADFWPAAKDAQPVPFERLLEECEVITGGVDGGGLDDLLGLGFVGRTKKQYEVTSQAYIDQETGEEVSETTRLTQKWLSWSYAWAHPSVLDRRKEIAPKLRDLAKLGQMSLVPAIGRDVDHLARLVSRVEKSGLLYQVGIDPAAIGGVLDAILLKDVPEDKMVTVNQGWRLAGAIKTTERKIAEGVLVHGGTELMSWSVGNAKVKVTGNAIVITKQVSGTAKIDPLMALFNAVSLMALNPPAQVAEFNFDNMGVYG